MMRLFISSLIVSSLAILSFERLQLKVPYEKIIKALFGFMEDKRQKERWEKKLGISFPGDALCQQQVNKVSEEAIKYYMKDKHKKTVTMKSVVNHYNEMGYHWITENLLKQSLKRKREQEAKGEQEKTTHFLIHKNKSTKNRKTKLLSAGFNHQDKKRTYTKIWCNEEPSKLLQYLPTKRYVQITSAFMTILSKWEMNTIWKILHSRMRRNRLEVT